MTGYLKWSCSRSCFTQDQRTKQQRQVDNRGYKQPSRIRPRPRFQKSHRYSDKHGSENQLCQKIKNRGDPEDRQRSTKKDSDPWSHSPGRNRARPRSLHQCVEFVFPPLIECSRASRGRRRSKNRVQECREVDWTYGAEIKTHCGRE